MCLAAALIGAITDTLRLELQDFNVAPEMATFIGAFLAGILASAWRSPCDVAGYRRTSATRASA